MNLTQRYRFSASHRLHSHDLPESRNWEVYGKCNNPHGHGHNYWLEVTVAGPTDPNTGQVAPRPLLDQWIGKEILARVEHRNLNEEMPEFARLVPTTENVARVFGEILARTAPQYLPPVCTFRRVRIYETRNNLFEMEAYEVQ
ncbi:MAG: 6-carboxytetrahydropterin synthase [Bryobacter sp.]|nr:6-carboxytetrahydropterin synthase [Bryobacter sp.]